MADGQPRPADDGSATAAGWRWWTTASIVLALAALLWQWPPAGDDAYHHSILAVEQAACLAQGDLWPRFHPRWNGGTGSFIATVYAPLAVALEGLLAAWTGEGGRAVALALVLGLAAGVLAIAWSGQGRERPAAWLWPLAAYPCAAVLARATVTEVWALAAAAAVLLLGLPPGPRRRRQAVALAVAAAIVAGLQASMVLQLAWLLAAGWSLSGAVRELRAALVAAGSVVGGVLLAGPLWWPLVAHRQHLAHEHLVGDMYDWRRHFVTSIAGNGELAPVLLAATVGLALVALISTLTLAQDTRARALVAVVAGAVVLASPISSPAWHLPGMEALQFPWRFLGPATVAALALIGSLEPGRLRAAAAAALIAPSLLIPVELGPARPPLEVAASPGELARSAAVRYGVAPVLAVAPGFVSRGFDPIRSLQTLTAQERRVEVLSGGCRQRLLLVAAGPPGVVRLPLQWWPEWRLRAGARRLPTANDQGLVAVELGADAVALAAELAPSRSRRHGAILTAAGCLWCALLVAFVRRDRTGVPPGAGS